MAEEHAAALTGFDGNPNLSAATWKFANTSEIAEFIRDHLAAVGNIYGIRDADLTRLNDPVSGPGTVGAAIV